MKIILARIAAFIFGACAFVVNAPPDVLNQFAQCVPQQYHCWLTLAFALAAYIVHNYGSNEARMAIVAKALRRGLPLLMLCLALGLSGCSLANKSNNGSLSGTGFYYDQTTGKIGAGILHASLLTHKDGAPAQVNVQNNYSWLPFDSSLSSSTVSVNFGNTVSSFSSTYSGSTAAVQFSETK